MCLDGYTGTYCQTGEYLVNVALCVDEVNGCVYVPVWLYRTYCQTGEYHVTRSIVCGLGTYCHTGENLVTRVNVCGRGKWLRVYMSGRLYRDLLPNRLMAVCMCLDGYKGTYCQTGEYLVTRVNVCERGKWLRVYISGWLHRDLLPNRALCVDEVNGYVCMCLDGYTGTYCQTGEYLVTRGIVRGPGTYCQTGEYHVTRSIVCGLDK
ncbi:hypothetical protein MAR_018620 [Mya arenaria]|uniref:EGF-like domain-containing protein n=1 Tax=Mya arenaria TaxID=6604 RepID=A0ABY7EF69_MYAAR|nr:hypothetical protein MAR_018620 [Mya arenaria]